MTAVLTSTRIHKNLSPEQLIDQAMALGLAQRCDTGAPVVRTGSFTGRSPKDKFFVYEKDSRVHWNDFNLPFEENHFHLLKTDLLAYLDSKEEIWSQDVYAGADTRYRVGLTCFTEFPDSSLFTLNMFIAPDAGFRSEWTLYQAPGFQADPAIHGTRQGNFAVISLHHKTILIGGTGYTGEIKKGMFTVMNYLLPTEKDILTMHCSANQGNDGDVALFFGLSGTGKTTLSADPNRRLIGDDEHAWTEDGIFNLEGGCYAKVIDLSPENEPQIFAAIRGQALLENVVFHPNSSTVDFADKSITENTRVSYPLSYIPGAVLPSVGGVPKNIFFLTCDAFGVLPPLSKLDPEQAMYFFLNGYTAKIAGTEEGIKEPKPTFSTCFGAPFLPLKPSVYAEMLKEKIASSGAQVWMVNTGWTGGGYGVGERIKLRYTRAMISAALSGALKEVITQPHPTFGVEVPLCCPGVPSQLLNPLNTWANKELYREESEKLAQLFAENHEKFVDLP